MKPQPSSQSIEKKLLSRLYRMAGSYFRRKRQKLLQKYMAERDVTTVIDIGGRPATWQAYSENAPPPKLVVIVNLPNEIRLDPPPGVFSVVADALALPFEDRQFDLTYSNSVIEHLGTLSNQQLFASEAMRVSKSYFIQTPNKEFPIEPHYLTPFIHWIPKPVRLKLIRNFTVWGWVERPTPEHCRNLIAELRLLNLRQLSSLFPGSLISKEKVCGLIKSLIAAAPRL